MRILLDTSAYAAFKKGDTRVVDFIQRARRIFVNPVVLGELLAGFRRGYRESKNRAELRAFLESPRVSVLPIDSETSERYAAILLPLLEKGKPVPANDLWIAATAMQHGLRVLSCDDHFAAIPQIVADIIASE